MNIFQISGHLITGGIHKSIYLEIDYSIVNRILKKERDKSLGYLKNALYSVEKLGSTKSKRKNVLQENSLCCGCGACASECPTNAIKIELDNNGFYCAELDDKKCISCGKCIRVCPFITRDNVSTLDKADLYSYKDKNAEVLLKSSSGGMAYKIAKDALADGRIVIGSIFDKEEHRAKHITIKPNQVEMLSLLQGSKYMQSNFAMVISRIRKSNSGAVVFGTPCQIAGVRNCIGSRKDILLVDLICHGVPSYHLYRKYLEYLQNNKGLDTQGFVNTIFRYKPQGWRDRYIYNENSETNYLESQYKDPYFLAFEFGFCYSKACYDCPWRAHSAADLRLGDYWHQKYANDKTGVSMVVALSKLGQAYMDRIIEQETCECQKQPIEDYFTCQQIKNNRMPVFWQEFIADLASDAALVDIINLYVMPFANRREISRKLAQIKGVLLRNGQN